jgi:hypothetical protein
MRPISEGNIRILGSGRIDDRESAFPQAVQLPDGEILCSFSVGGGPNVTGGSDWARSRDGGCSWEHGGTILAASEDPPRSNHLKLSLSKDGKTIFAYGCRQNSKDRKSFGENLNEPVLCTSRDNGATWSAPRIVPLPREGNFEISHGALPLASGRLLAPTATLPGPGRLGEKVVVGISDDGGNDWPRHSIVFQDPEGRLGYFEHKFAEISPGTIVATAWTVTLARIEDRTNRYTISLDNGESWSPPMDTGVRGQTMTPFPLGKIASSSSIIDAMENRALSCSWFQWQEENGRSATRVCSTMRANIASGPPNSRTAGRSSTDLRSVSRPPSLSPTAQFSPRTGAGRTGSSGYAGRSSSSIGSLVGLSSFHGEN